MRSAHQQSPSPASFSAGVVIALSAVVSIAAVALDTQAQGSDPLSILQDMTRLRDAHQLIHMVAMACIGGFMYGYSVLSQRLGLRRPPVLAALVAYACGSMLMFIATVIDGFVSTGTAALFASKSPEAVRVGYWMVQVMAGVALPDIARVAWVCQSVAAVAWSIAMLGEAGMSRKLGMAGLVCGALPALALVAAGSRMTDTVVIGILLVQAVWNFTAAIYLLRPASPGMARLAGADSPGVAAGTAL